MQAILMCCNGNLFSLYYMSDAQSFSDGAFRHSKDSNLGGNTVFLKLSFKKIFIFFAFFFLSLLNKKPQLLSLKTEATVAVFAYFPLIPLLTCNSILDFSRHSDSLFGFANGAVAWSSNGSNYFGSATKEHSPRMHSSC